jgi:hypothetical protein
MGDRVVTMSGGLVAGERRGGRRPSLVPVAGGAADVA